MSYYDHATAMAFRVGRWKKEQELRNFELEEQAFEHRASATAVKNQSFVVRCLVKFRFRRSSGVSSQSKCKGDSAKS